MARIYYRIEPAKAESRDPRSYEFQYLNGILGELRPRNHFESAVSAHEFLKRLIRDGHVLAGSYRVAGHKY